MYFKNILLVFVVEFTEKMYLKGGNIDATLLKS